MLMHLLGIVRALVVYAVGLVLVLFIGWWTGIPLVTLALIIVMGLVAAYLMWDVWYFIPSLIFGVVLVGITWFGLAYNGITFVPGGEAFAEVRDRVTGATSSAGNTISTVFATATLRPTLAVPSSGSTVPVPVGATSVPTPARAATSTIPVSTPVPSTPVPPTSAPAPVSTPVPTVVSPTLAPQPPTPDGTKVALEREVSVARQTATAVSGTAVAIETAQTRPTFTPTIAQKPTVPSATTAPVSRPPGTVVPTERVCTPPLDGRCLVFFSSNPRQVEVVGGLSPQDLCNVDWKYRNTNGRPRSECIVLGRPVRVTVRVDGFKVVNFLLNAQPGVSDDIDIDQVP